MRRVFPASPRRYHSLHLSPKEAVLFKPSTWPSSFVGDPYSYGLRLRGAYIVDLDKDRIIPFEIKDLRKLLSSRIEGIPISQYIGDPITQRYAYTIIASAASPGGLYSKLVSKHARGVYVVLPSVTLNIDIVRGKMADSGYSIAVPLVSNDTMVRTNIVLMNSEQAKLMDLSEIKNGNYYIASYDSKKNALSYFLEQDGSYKVPIPSISYFGNKSGLCIGKSTFLGMNVQATNRPNNIVEASLDHYFSEVFYMANIEGNPIKIRGVKQKITSGNELLLKLKYLYESRREDAHRMINEINNRLEKKGRFDQILYKKKIPIIHDTYERDNKGKIILNKKNLAVSKDYDPRKVYEKYRLLKVLE